MGLRDELSLGSPQSQFSSNPAGIAAPNNSDDLSVGDYALDVGKGLVGGVRGAAQETIDFTYDAVNWVDNLTSLDWIDDKKDTWFTLPGQEALQTRTTAGTITKGVTQFLVGFLGAGKFMAVTKAASLLSKAGKAAKIIKPMAQGALADMVAIDPHEERFSNLIESFPALRNPITEYLSAEHDDGMLEGRLKNALEGVVLGVAADGLISLVKGIRAARFAKTEADKADAIGKSLTEAEEVFKEVKEPIGPLPADDAVDIMSGTDEAAYTDVTKPAGEIPDTLRVEDPFKGDVVDAVKAEEEISDLVHKISMGAEGVADIQHLNFRRYTSQEVAVAMDAQLSKNMQHVDKLKITKEQFEKDVANYTSKYGIKPEVFKDMAQDLQAMKELRVKMAYYDGYFSSVAQDFNQFAKLVDLGDQSPSTMARFMWLSEQLAQGATMVKMLKSEQGRGLRSLQWRVSPFFDAIDPKTINDALVTRGGEFGIRKLAKAARMAADNPRALARIFEGNKWINASNEFFINAILSGPRTHIVNTTANAIKTFLTPAEMYIGAKINKDPAVALQAKQTFVGLFQHMKDSWAAVRASWRLDDNILDPAQKAVEKMSGNTINHAISGEAMGMDGWKGSWMSSFGKIINAPTRFMASTDEFFKQINYRSYLKAHLYRKGTEMGKEDDELAQWIGKKFDEAFDADRGIAGEALQYAREITYSQSLDYGLGQNIQKLVNSAPALRQLAPFVRTPTNIIRDAWAHTPVISKKLRFMKADLTSADPTRRAMAEGKMAVGKMFWATAGMAAASGALTGGGPRDPKLRASLMESGWQPYSVRIGDRYFSYQRLEPFGTLLGLAADFADMASGDTEDFELDNLAGALVATVAANITSKTYLKGLIDTANVLADPERWGERWIQQQIAARIPFSSLLGQTRQIVDPAIRDVQSASDAILNKLPFFSEKVAPRVSWITGEPVVYPGGSLSPVAWRQTKSDPIINELIQLDRGFSAPMRNLGGVELSSDQYSKLNTLHGTIKLGGRTMKQSLEKLINSKQYDLARERIPDPPNKYSQDNFRMRAVRSIIGAYRDAAQKQLLKEDGKLLQDWLISQMNIKAARGGRPDLIK